MSQTKSVIGDGECLIPIPDGLKLGDQILVEGQVPNTGDRFHINLQTGDVQGCDVPFHFNPRFPQAAMVRNTFHNGSWGVEERDVSSFEFAHGAKFAIRMLVMQDRYSVSVNGKHYLDYNHRLPFEDVRYLSLSPGAEYDQAEVQIACGVPISGTLPRHFQVGDAFRVRGIVTDSPNRFAIDLKTDPTTNIAIHVNPRQDQTDVVFNTRSNAGWGAEQRGTWNSHFDAGSFFDISIIAHTDHFVICVNDEYFQSYNYRMPVTDICYWNIWGDVILMDIDFCQNMDQNQIKALSHPMDVKDVIAVEGYFHGENRFHIDLMNGTNGADDVAIHFNPRRYQGEIVFNTKVSGGWQTEEKIPLPSELALDCKCPFLVEIFYHGSHFDVYLNGHKIYTFNDRNNRPITGVRCQGEAYFYQALLLNETHNPYVDHVPRPLQTGTWVSLTCRPHANADRFAINLQSNDSTTDGNNIVYHINPRFVGQVTVNNTFSNGWWGTEERKTDHFPFVRYDRYKIFILTMDNEYRVYVNKSFFLSYAHRLSISEVSHVRLYEDGDFHAPRYHFL